MECETVGNWMDEVIFCKMVVTAHLLVCSLTSWFIHFRACIDGNSVEAEAFSLWITLQLEKAELKRHQS